MDRAITIGRCKDCRFWSRIKNFEIERTFDNPNSPKWTRFEQSMFRVNDRWDVVIAEREPSKFGDCSCPKIAEGIGPAYTDELPYMGTDDNDEMSLFASYSDSDATCETGENFGCVHFKAKE